MISSGFANETVPVFAIICEVQQVNCWRSAKTKQPAVGSPDKIERCRYVFEMTRDAAELENDLTGGWKVVNVSDCCESAVQVAARLMDSVDGQSDGVTM